MIQLLQHYVMAIDTKELQRNLLQQAPAYRRQLMQAAGLTEEETYVCRLFYLQGKKVPQIAKAMSGWTETKVHHTKTAANRKMVHTLRSIALESQDSISL